MGSKAGKKRVSRGDLFVHKEQKTLVRVMKVSKEHQSFGDMLGTITVRPFTFSRPAQLSYTLQTSGAHDVHLTEYEYAYVRPSNVVVTQGAH